MLDCLECTSGLVAVERVANAKLFATKAAIVDKHFGKVTALDVGLYVVLGLMLEVGAEAAAPGPLVRLGFPSHDVLVEMFRTAGRA